MKTLTAFALLTLASALSHAADKGGVSDADRKFLEKAARAGYAEVKAAGLAKGKADLQEVKDFARQMEDDHTKANDELKKLADSKGVALPTDVDRKHKRIEDELRSHTAGQFDHEYMKAQVKDHKDAVSEFEHEAKNGRDADIRKFASDKLPTLRHHLEMAQAAEAAAKKIQPRASQQPGRDPSGSMAK